MNLLHLYKKIDCQPAPPVASYLSLRNYQSEADIPIWLDLRHRAFAREQVGVRRWTLEDFQSEVLVKPWWSPGRLWIASEASPGGDPETPVGTVILAERASPNETLAAIHWLAVLPRWRRRGVGRALIATLELAAWQAGYREIALETHRGWSAAAVFYDALGYRAER